MNQQTPIIIITGGNKKKDGGGLVILLVGLFLFWKFALSVPEPPAAQSEESTIVARPAEFDALMNQMSAPINPPVASIIPPPQLAGDCTNSVVNTSGQLLSRDQIVVQNADGSYSHVIDFCTTGVCGYNTVTYWPHVFEHYDEIVEKSPEGCFNPAFTLAMYIEETGAGNYDRFGLVYDMGVENYADGRSGKVPQNNFNEQLTAFLMKYKQYAFTERSDIAACRGDNGLSLREFMMMFGPDGPQGCVNNTFTSAYKDRLANIYVALTGGTGQLDFSQK